MRNFFVGILFACVVTSFVEAADPANGADKNWAQWRGPSATGVAPHGSPPTEWSETKNIRWKVEIPGRGHATPIIWGDRIYIQTAIKTDREAEPDENAAAKAEENRARNEAPPWDPNRKQRIERLTREGKKIETRSRARRGGRGRGRTAPTHIH